MVLAVEVEAWTVAAANTGIDAGDQLGPSEQHYLQWEDISFVEAQEGSLVMPVPDWGLLPVERLDFLSEQILEVDDTGSEAAVHAGTLYLLGSLDHTVGGRKLTELAKIAENYAVPLDGRVLEFAGFGAG